MSHNFKPGDIDKQYVEPKTKRSAMFRRPRRVSIETGSECNTEQHHRDICDVNFIMQRHGNPHPLSLPIAPGNFVDLSNFDYSKAMNMIADIKSQFYKLPASVREEYDNDPAIYIQNFETNELGKLEKIKKDKEFLETKAALDKAQSELKDKEKPAK